MLNNLTIKARLVLLVCVMMVIGSSVAISAYRGLDNLQDATQDIAERRITLIRDVNKIMYFLADNRAQISLAMQHDPANPYGKQHEHEVSLHLDLIETNVRKIDELFAATKPLTHSAEGKAGLASFIEARDLWLHEGVLPAVEAIRAGHYEQVHFMLSKNINPLLDEAIRQGREIAQHEDEGAQHSLEKAKAAAHTTELIIIWGMLFMAAVTVALGYSIISGVSRSTGEMRDVMTRMGADGDLSRRIKVSGSDEVAQASHAFNNFIEGVATIIRQVNANASSVSDTAAQLANASTLIATGSQTQSAAAASTATSVEAMTVSINSVAANTQDVRKLSEQSLQKAAQGNQNVAVMITEIQRVQDAVKLIAGSVNEFVESTRAIAGMTQQVKDIADQTNLLALNAAIEAARAGEQGRGFAVVADEVRKLAEKSAQSANEIDQVTNSLSQKSNHVEASVQTGLRSLQATQEQVDRVSVALHEASDAVTQASHGVNDIATAVSEQSQASTEIARNVEKIAQMSKDNSAAVSSNNKDIAHLDELAKALQQVVSRFRV
ncbi:MAG: hypothetical protein RL358_66 [Pseudomonadota bacterium]|jgi:methyl-accepting chemotaxis protein